MCCDCGKWDGSNYWCSSSKQNHEWNVEGQKRAVVSDRLQADGERLRGLTSSWQRWLKSTVQVMIQSGFSSATSRDLQSYSSVGFSLRMTDRWNDTTAVHAVLTATGGPMNCQRETEGLLLLRFCPGSSKTQTWAQFTKLRPSLDVWSVRWRTALQNKTAVMFFRIKVWKPCERLWRAVCWNNVLQMSLFVSGVFPTVTDAQVWKAHIKFGVLSDTFFQTAPALQLQPLSKDGFKGRTTYTDTFIMFNSCLHIYSLSGNVCMKTLKSHDS